VREFLDGLPWTGGPDVIPHAILGALPRFFRAGPSTLFFFAGTPFMRTMSGDFLFTIF